MKRITSSLLALLLTLSMLIGMVPAVYATDYTDTIEPIDSTETVDSAETEDVSDEAEEVAVQAADGYVAEVGGTKYDNLKTAISNMTTGSTLTLLDDVDLGTSAIGFYKSGTENLTFDLNGHTITSSYDEKGTVTATRNGLLIMNGTIVNNSTNGKSTTSAVYVSNGGTTTLRNVKLISNMSGLAVCDLTSSTTNAISATVTIEDGTTMGDQVQYGIYLSSLAATSKKERAVTLNINGGTITGTKNGVYVNGPGSSKYGTVKASITGGTVSDVMVSTGDGPKTPVDIAISGGTITGALTSLGTNEVAISGGTIEGDLKQNGGSISITGGTIEGALDNTKGTITVTGGTFTTADPSDYLADGYEFVNGQVTSSSSSVITTSEQLIAAINAANDGDTITLGEGNFTTYGNTSPKKSLTFVGSGAGTVWTIGDLTKNVNGEGNGDYSFDGCDTITFKSMTLKSDGIDYRGFIRVTNTVVEDCVLDGKTAYWGYGTAKFIDSTFNAPEGDYALWDYSTKDMTFNGCTFNISGKGVNVYVEAGNASGTRTVTVKDCTVESTKENKAFLNIKNSTQSYDVTFSGTNTVNGLVKDKTTGSNLFQVEADKITENSGKTVTVKEKAADGTEKLLYEVTADTVPSGYVEDTNGNVTISDEDGLFWFAKQVNEVGNTFNGKTVALANDIALTKTWEPIGDFNGTAFKGTFDGGNHTVSGVRVTEYSTNGVGFFAKTYIATIKNLTVEGTIDAYGCNYVGGIVGHGYATITNCTFRGTITNADGFQIGGIAGSGGFTVSNCSVYGDISGEGWVGGIAGNVQDGGAYTNCYVEGTISAENAYYGVSAAGIAAIPLYKSQVISGCYCNAIVKCDGEEINAPIIGGYNGDNNITADTELFIQDNSWNKQKNPNDSYEISESGTVIKGKTASRDNNLIMLEDDLKYVTGNLSDVKIMAGSTVTQEQVEALAVASNGDNKYASLGGAIAAANDGDTVKLLKSCSGNGIAVPAGKFNEKGLIVDFNNCTYTVGGILVGSTATKSNAFQLLKDNTITFQNGKIYGDAAVAGDELTDWTGAPAIMIQNYSNLTLDHMEVVGGEETCYTLSNNYGDTHIKASTITAGKAKGTTYTPVAFDICRFSSYNDVSVTVEDGSVINGNIAIGENNPQNGEKQKATLTLTSGTVNNGSLIDDGIKNFDLITVTKSKTFDVAAPDGYEWANNVLTKVTYVAEINGTKYDSLQKAFDAAVTGDTVTLLTDITLTEQVNITKALNGLTLAGNGKTITCATTDDPSKSGGSALYFGNATDKLYCTGIKIKDLSMTGMARYGIFLCGGTTTEFTNVNISGEYYIAINLYGTHGATMTNCNISNSKTGIDKYSSAIWTNVASANPLRLDNTKVDTIAINTYGKDNKLEPKIYVMDGSSVDEIHTFDDASVSMNKKLCVSTESTGSYTIKEYVDSEWVDLRVAETGGTYYSSLQEAIDNAKANATVTLLCNTRENVTVSKKLTLDLNGYTLNGGQVKASPALKVDNASVTVKDSSENQTGTIMREDTAENSGVSSHYVIDIQGKYGFLKFEGGNVVNNSGNDAAKGASLIRLGNDSVAGAYPTLTITGGKFTQDNFVVIKVDRGTLHFNGGEVNSANSYAIENWNNAYIKGGTVNGTVSSWVYSTGAAFSKLEIVGGTVNGNVASVNYDSAADKQARIYITGGYVTGTLGTYTYSNGLVPTDETAMATVEVTGGTFEKDPTKYVVENSKVKTNEDGTFGVEKTYLAKIGDTSYYTMDEAFKAVKAGETITMLRDYTTNKIQNSGSKSFTIDLGGYTWTYTGTDTDSAAFEINYSDVTLTVTNGKVESASMLGLIPSAMSGTITYNNAGLVFEGIEATANGHSGIETSGNNTDDTVILKNSTLNVPNGFGIYFASSGTLTIEDSVITAKTMGVQVCAGSLNISGEKTAITVTGDAVPKTEDDGPIEDGAAISIVNRTGYKGLVDVTVTGGTFTAKSGNAAIKAYDWANKTESKFTESTKVGVSGGKFSAPVPEDLCADGYMPAKNDDGTYGVKVAEYVAAIGDKQYTSIAAAVKAANAGDTITLIANFTTDATKTTAADQLIVDKDITLDLAGYTMTVPAELEPTSNFSAFFITGGTMTVKDSSEAKTGTIRSGDENTLGTYLFHLNRGNLVIESGMYFAGCTVVNVHRGTATINGGTFAVYVDKDEDSRYLLNCIDATYKSGEAHIVVNGGTFKDYDPRNNLAEGADTNFVAEGVGVDYVDGSFTAKSGMVAQRIDGNGQSVKAYASLTSALEAVKSGETVKLLSNVTIDSASGLWATLETANVTLDLNGYTIDGSSVSLNAANKAVLTLSVSYDFEGSGTIKITSSTEGGAILGKLPLQIAGASYADTVRVEVDDSVKLTVQEGGENAVFLDNSTIYLLGTETTKAFYKNGGFMVTVNDEMHIYETLGAARSKNSYVTLLGDFTTTGAVSVWNDWGAFTLDLNGHTYMSTATGNMFELKGSTNATFKNGTLKATNAESVIGVPDGYNDNTLTLDNVNVVTDGSYGIATNGTSTNNNITLINSNIKAPNGMGVYFPSTGKLTINGGSIEANTGVQICAGSLEITGEPTITATGAGVAGKDGAILDGAAVSIVKRSGYGEIGTVTIDSGKFTSAAGVKAVQAYGTSDTWAGAKDHVDISGGTFSSIPANMADLCKIGFAAVQNEDGSYTVKEVSYNAYYTNDNEEVVYGDFTALVASTNKDTKDKTIVLLKDVKVDDNLVLFGNRTVDLNGNVLEIPEIFIGLYGKVSDSSDGNGLLKVAADNATLAPENGQQLPLYDSTKNGYRLFSFTMREEVSKPTTTSAKFKFGPIFENKEAYKLLQAGNNHNIKITVTLRWTTEDGQELSGEQTFTFPENLVNGVGAREGKSAFTIVLTGFDSDVLGSVKDVTVEWAITSGTGASVSGTPNAIS